MLNRIVLMGRLTRDPELRRTQSGTAVASFSIACDRDYAAQGAERETDFIDIVAWRGTAEFVEKYFSKGRMIVVAGRLQIRNWQDKEGNKRRSAEILADSVYFGDSKRDGDSGKAKGEPAYDPTGGFSQLADPILLSFSIAFPSQKRYTNPQNNKSFFSKKESPRWKSKENI